MTNAPRAPRSETIQALQLLRAVAAIAVVIAHVGYDFAHKLTPPDALPDILSVGNAGVDLFFVISGFVMVYSSESLFGREGAATAFLTRRIARIVPLYWLMGAAMLADVAIRGFAASDSSPALAALSFGFIPCARPSGEISPLYGVGWTLNFEMLFYAIFAASLAKRREMTVARAALVLTVLALGAVFKARLPMPLSYWCDGIVFEFAAGMALALAYRRGVRIHGWFAILLLGAAATAVAIYLAHGGDEAWRWLGYGLPAAEIVAALTLLKRDIAIGWLGRIGDASYALYLGHPVVIAAARMLAQRGYLAPATRPWLYLCGIVVVSIAAALLIYRLIERPLTFQARRLLAAPVKPRTTKP